MPRPRLITAPAEYPIELADVRNTGVIEEADDNAVLRRLILQAIDHFDGYNGRLGRCMISQTWAVDFSEWSMTWALPFPDVQTATIKYRDASDVEQTLPATEFEVVNDHGGGMICFVEGFTRPTLYTGRVFPITVEFTAGYGDEPENVPPSVRSALISQVLLDFGAGESAETLERDITRKLAGHRWVA